MASLREPRQERFCQLMAAGGLTIDAAYSQAGFKPDRSHASRLASKGHIMARIDEIRAEAEKLAGSAVLTLAEKRSFLARVVRAKVADTPADSDLWQAVEYSANGVKYKLGDKIKAIITDNDLASEGAAAGAAGTMAEAIARILRKGGA